MQKIDFKIIFPFLLFIGFIFLSSCKHETVAENMTVTTDVVISNFGLKDQNGDSHNLYDYADKKAVVLFIHGNACPIVRNAISDLKAIRTKFEEKEVKFLMLNANLQDDRESVAKEAIEFNIDFPILLDETQSAAETLKLYRTAEAIVLNPGNWKIIYRGPINDRVGYESQRNNAKNHYLEDALNAQLKGEAPKEARIKSKGCLIKIARK